jgi:hypothetical protein
VTTDHGAARKIERRVDESDIRETVLRPESERKRGKGPHGGIVYHCKKHFSAGELNVVVEIHKETCYIVTTYYAMKQTRVLQVKASSKPVVELDSANHAAYVRFSKKAVAKTLVENESWPLVTVDIDADQNVVGVELVGVKEFTIQKMIAKTSLRVPAKVLERASYVPMPIAA